MVVHVFQEERASDQEQHMLNCFQVHRVRNMETFVGAPVCTCGGRLSVLSYDFDVYAVWHPRVMV
jgi:hypothetical protein